MDAEQQVRLNFLEEAHECCDRIESSLLGVSASVAEPAKLDLALRSSHSIKGGASLMGYGELSQSAHRLEDFLKILRVRHANTVLDPQLETLFLQSVDRLRELADLCRSPQGVDPNWIQQHLSPIYTDLQLILGDLQDTDEDALLHQNEDSDPALQMFEEGVDRLVDEFEEQIHLTLEPQAVRAALSATVESLLPFGYMAELDAFIELCQEVQGQSAHTPDEKIRELSEAAVVAWRRSHGLVVRRSLEKLPNQLEQWQPVLQSDVAAPLEDSQAEDFERQLNALIDEPDEYDALDVFELSRLQDEFSESPQSLFETPAIPDNPFEAVNEVDLEAIDLNEVDLGELVEANTDNEIEADPFAAISLDEDVIETLQQAFEQPIQPPAPERLDSNETDIPEGAPISGQSIRISADQLYQFNTLFSQLVLERNAILAQMEQLKADSTLMRRRISKLSKSNTQLRKWYDRASLEGVITTPVNQPSSSTANTLHATRASDAEFDALEMDQYSDLHVISQDQIETLVQLQEVATDLDTGIKSVERVVKDLRQTTQLMQKNVTKVQMMPFDDLVKRFPRAVRDLSQKFNKSVQLSIEGTSVLIDRAVTDVLGDALLQLLQNAVDHGLESTQRRAELGKSPQGSIVLRAENRSGQTVITLRDDGAGIQLERIRDRLNQLGVDRAEVLKMTDTELMNFIFEPGFSTATQVTEVSGRGVGMDLVRTNLAEIRGEISVQSRLGEGTTFTLQVPYNLSIMKVSLVERAGIVFALPVDSIREISKAADQTPHIWNGVNLPQIDLQEYLSYTRPGQRFEMPGNPIINRESIVIAGDAQHLGAFVLDRFWGEQEVTIQPISKALPLPPGFSSSLIMGDGRVIPLVDPSQLVEWCATQTPVEGRPDLFQLPALQETEPTILVVDDSINVRKLLTITLEKAGFKVEQAKDGQDAVDRMLTGLQVNAVICDIEMPRLDGYGFLEEIKSQQAFRRLPILMLTSRSNDKHRKLAMNLGASGYFAKPYNESDLIAKLNELIIADS